MNVFLNKKRFRWQKIAVSTVVLVLYIVFLNIFNQQIKNTFYAATQPFSKILWDFGRTSSGFFQSIFNYNGLVQENSNLKEENQNLLSQIALLQETIKADQSIKEVAQNTQGNNFKMTLAETIGLDGDFILLNKGADDGILENMPVISSQKALFGKVYKVYKNYSQVMLISNKNSVIDVKIQKNETSEPAIYGAIKGSGNLSLYLDLVSSDAQIMEQDVLITSGLEGTFPKDLLVGKIVESSKNDQKPFQTAKVLPFFDVKNIENLFIITNYKK